MTVSCTCPASAPSEPAARRHGRLRRLAAVATLALAGTLAGCGAMNAQNPPGALRPVNAVAEGDARVMLRGADVVAYFTEGRHVQGSPAFAAEHEGVTFHFASDAHRRQFIAAPARFLPQYGGYCANGIVYGIPWGGDADRWRIVDGRLFIFGGQASRDAFELDVAGNVALADRYWKDEVAGSNSFVQRARRLVFRVPHYASGETLAARVAAARAGAAR